jgi:hypothetical protein
VESVYLVVCSVADISRHVLPVRQPAKAENYISKIREVADVIVPWGTNKAIGLAKKK